MENKRNYNNRNKGSNNNQRAVRTEKPQPQRKRRVTVDRDVEVVVVSNTIGRFYYSNPRMSMVIDLHKIGDEEYITVGDLRTILNSSRKVLEGFQILITEVMHEDYTVEDVLIFLGLDKRYNEYLSLTKKLSGSNPEIGDIKDFLIKAPVQSFERIMKNMDEKLRGKIIESAVTLFKLKEFADYNKMQIIESFVSEDLFEDAKDTEVDKDIYI